jgi:colanic acid biosynthesis glycosyl transferase WcaI
VSSAGPEKHFRLLVLSEYYDPEPVPKPAALARALKERGHEVSVVTGLPHYPGDRLHPGYALRPLVREWRDGIGVVRAFEWPYHGKSALRRALNYGSFMLSAPLAALFAPDADVLYVWHPPLTVGVAAWLIARWRGIPFVYDVQDIWPESVAASGLVRRPWMLRVLAALEKFVYAQAEHILVVTEGAKTNLVEKGVEARRIAVVPGWVESDELAVPAATLRDETRARLSWGDDFVVLFTGNLGVLQDLETLVLSARQLGGRRVRIALAGEGSDRGRLESLAMANGLGNVVEFLGQLPKEAMPALLAAADVLAVLLKKSLLSELVIPSKTYSYLAAGRPIVSCAGGATDRLVLGLGVGSTAPTGDPAALARAILSLRDAPESERNAMGEKARSWALANLGKEAVVGRHEAILRAVARATT